MPQAPEKRARPAPATEGTALRPSDRRHHPVRVEADDDDNDGRHQGPDKLEGRVLAIGGALRVIRAAAPGPQYGEQQRPFDDQEYHGGDAKHEAHETVDEHRPTRCRSWEG